MIIFDLSDKMIQFIPPVPPGATNRLVVVWYILVIQFLNSVLKCGVSAPPSPHSKISAFRTTVRKRGRGGREQLCQYLKHGSFKVSCSTTHIIAIWSHAHNSKTLDFGSRFYQG